MINFTFLSENKTENSRIKAEFGLSIYIETDCMKILFDAGASDIFYDNAERLGIVQPGPRPVHGPRPEAGGGCLRGRHDGGTAVSRIHA